MPRLPHPSPRTLFCLMLILAGAVLMVVGVHMARQINCPAILGPGTGGPVLATCQGVFDFMATGEDATPTYAPANLATPVVPLAVDATAGRLLLTADGHVLTCDGAPLKCRAVDDVPPSTSWHGALGADGQPALVNSQTGQGSRAVLPRDAGQPDMPVLHAPQAVAWLGRSVLIADTQGRRVIELDGDHTTILQTRTLGALLPTRPIALAPAGAGFWVVLADVKRVGRAVVRLDRAGELKARLALPDGMTPASVVEIPDDAVYVLDRKQLAIHRFTVSGDPLPMRAAPGVDKVLATWRGDQRISRYLRWAGIAAFMSGLVLLLNPHRQLRKVGEPITEGISDDSLEWVEMVYPRRIWRVLDPFAWLVLILLVAVHMIPTLLPLEVSIHGRAVSATVLWVVFLLARERYRRTFEPYGTHPAFASDGINLIRRDGRGRMVRYPVEEIGFNGSHLAVGDELRPVEELGVGRYVRQDIDRVLGPLFERAGTQWVSQLERQIRSDSLRQSMFFVVQFVAFFLLRDTVFRWLV